MKARLKDGTVVTLTKDCGCLTHEGPHWLHMDALIRESNHRRMLPRGFFDAGVSMITLHAYATEELIRLQEKRYQMLAQGIEQLLPDADDVARFTLTSEP